MRVISLTIIALLWAVPAFAQNSSLTLRCVSDLDWNAQDGKFTLIMVDQDQMKVTTEYFYRGGSTATDYILVDIGERYIEAWTADQSQRLRIDRLAGRATMSFDSTELVLGMDMDQRIEMGLVEGDEFWSSDTMDCQPTTAAF